MQKVEWEFFHCSLKLWEGARLFWTFLYNLTPYFRHSLRHLISTKSSVWFAKWFGTLAVTWNIENLQCLLCQYLTWLSALSMKLWEWKVLKFHTMWIGGEVSIKCYWGLTLLGVHSRSSSYYSCHPLFL